MHARGFHGSGGLFGGSGTAAAVFQADNQVSNSYARLLEVLSEGPIVGLVNGYQSIFFDGTPLANADGTLNYNGVGWDIRLGSADQDWMQGFSTEESEVGTGLNEVKHLTGPVVRSTAVPDLDAVRVSVRFARLVNQGDNGSVSGTTVDYAIEFKHNTEVAWTPFPGSPFTVTGKSSSGFEKQHYCLIRPVGETRTGPWQIRFTRITPDHDGDKNISDAFTWTSWTDIIESKFIYPDTAYVGLQIPSVTFGSVPVRTFDIYGRIIRVPANYIPNAYNLAGDVVTPAAYSGIWDGTFRLAWTDNPAWILLDMLTHPRYGLGFTDDMIDTAGLYTISQYCDELIDDGQGNMRPRFTLNACITKQEDAYDLLNKIVTNFRTMIYYASGGIFFAQDSPRQPDFEANQTNVIDGLFTYSEQSYADTSNVLLVTWTNPDLNDKGDATVVQSPRDVAARGAVTSTYASFGVREEWRANNLGRWALYTNFNDGEAVTYRAGLDHCDVVPGWVGVIKDPVADGVRTGGRVKFAELNTITLDKEVALEAGATYQLLLVHPDKTLNRYNVVSGPGTLQTLTLDRIPPPSDGALWGLASSGIQEKLWRVISRTNIEKTTFEITAIRYHTDKFVTVESPLPLDPNQYTFPNRVPVGIPRDLTASEYITVNAAGVVVPAVLVSWKASTDPRVTRYMYQTRDSTGTWSPGTLVNTLSVDLLGTPEGVFSVRVRSETSLSGRKSDWVQYDLNLLGLNRVPADVTGARLVILGDRATLAWDLSPDLLIRNYEVRFSSLLDGANWIASSVMLQGVLTNSVDVPALTGTYLIKAVAYGGKYSQNAALVETDIASQSKINVVENFVEQPGWTGAKTDVDVITGRLKLKSLNVLRDIARLSDVHTLSFGVGAGFAISGEYAFAEVLDLTAVYKCRITSKLQAFGNKASNTLRKWTTLGNVTSLSGITQEDWSAKIFVRMTNDDPAAGGAVWGPWLELRVGDYVFRGLQAKLVLKSISSDLTPEVSVAELLIDMPDRVLGDNNVPIPAAGLRINFAPAFKALKGLGVTMQGLQSGDKYVTSSEGPTGFNIQVFNSAGATKTATFHWDASGYGRVAV